MKLQSKCLIVVAAAQSSVAASTPSSLSSITSSKKTTLRRRSSEHYSNVRDVFAIMNNIRGGAIDIDETSKKKHKKKSSKSPKAKGVSINTHNDNYNNDKDEDAKVAINTAMKDSSDTAASLGEAIRARAHILRKDKLPLQERTFDSALVSLGLSLGTAGLDNVDQENEIIRADGEDEEGDEIIMSTTASSAATKATTMMAYYQYGHNGNSHQQNQQFVQPSTSAVIANYFLKTHGGTHLLQCVLSLLASVLGVACLVLPSFPTAASAAALVAKSTTNDSILILYCNNHIGHTTTHTKNTQLHHQISTTPTNSLTCHGQTHLCIGWSSTIRSATYTHIGITECTSSFGIGSIGSSGTVFVLLFDFGGLAVLVWW